MKKKSARSLALLTAAAMTATTFFGTGIPVVQAADEWIGDEDLKDNSTDAPEKDTVLPSTNQYNYQKEELAAFCHFGPNTFNEIEWGENYGDKEPNEIFKLTQDFDAETLVKAVKEAGFHKLIVTAKHHDGFCIWDSEYTDYDVAAATNYPGDATTQRRDILEEISAACTEHDIDMGLYLSPWDIHDKSYGYYDENGNSLLNSNGQPLNGMTWEEVEEKDVYDYNEYYNNQLEEILGDDRYGNDGHFVEVWMDGAKGSGASAQNYDFERWFDTIQKNEGIASGNYDSDCMLFGAQAYTTVRWIGNENGYADKNTWSKSKVNYETNSIDSRSQGGYTLGWEDGNQWTVPEADARITSGWFWGTTKAAPKSIEALGTMYFNSVGHNSPLLLNIPPNNQGTVDDAILDRLEEFGDNIAETFDDNLAAAEGASVFADNVRGNDTAYKPGNTVDGNDSTYWTTEDGASTGTLLIDLGGVKTFDVVSVEEAIQNGQRINEYTIEYRDKDGEWNTLDSGETIGAKRLARTAAVKGDQVKITVSTTEGKVPMISEVGVYKASDGFELAGSAPDGMDVIDISNADSFNFSSGWTDEAGSNFIGGTNKWANAGASFTLKFEGTKVYLLGTKDPNHGTAEVYIDGELAETIDTNATSRLLGQMIFESEDLADGTHTLELKVKTKAIGIESAYVINNGGKGMIGLEADSYTMNEESRMDVKLFRVGGSKGEVSVQVAPNPGSAIQDDFNTELITTVTFKDGQTEATAPVETRRNTNTTGDREFSIELTALTDDLIVGFNDKATVTIIDTESSSKETLQALVDEGTAAEPEWYTSGWDAYIAAVTEGAAVLEKADATTDEIAAAISGITEAKADLTAREQYTAEDPFAFPWQKGSSATLEAEFSELNDVVLASDGQWSLRVSEANWASNGKIINCLNQQDTISIPYYAEKAGTYSFTAYYRSGDTKNALSWSEPDNKITADTVTAGAGDQAGATHEVTFDVVVTEAGAGTLVFTGPDSKSPQLDKFEIVPKEIELREFTITASAGEGGSISDAGSTTVTEGDSKTYTITPDEGYAVADVKVNGVSVGAVDTYTFENVSADATIEAEFAFSNYTSANPFVFPTEENGEAVTLEAEYATELINSNDSDSDPNWPLGIGSGDWASKGKFVNCLAYKDYIKYAYRADVAGTYEVTMTYKSGDINNKIQWSSDPEANIAEGTKQVENGNQQVDTVTFNMTVSQPGAGTLILTAPDAKKGPQIDKFEIRLIEKAGEVTTADKAELEKVLNTAKTEAAKTDVYTPESIAALNAAIEAAQAVYDKAEALQSEVDSQVTALQEAIDALEELPEPPQTYTITASAGEGGSIDPSGEVTVNAGETQTFTITADEGYVIADVKVNGESVGAVESYEMNAAGTIEAVFKAESTQPDPETPTREDLWDALEAAKALLEQTDKYTEDSLAAYQEVYDTAYLTYESDNAGADDFAAAIKALEDGKALLEEKGSETPDPTPGEDPDKPGAGTDKPDKGSSADKAVQTGDSSSPILWAAVLAAACAAGTAAVRTRTKKNK